jgi:hypothetical protein
MSSSRVVSIFASGVGDVTDTLSGVVEREKKKPRLILYVLGGAAVLAAVPLAMKWADMRADDPVTRLQREKGEIVAAVLAMAKKDLHCETEVDVREPNGELWAHGCGKRARYVPGKNGAFSLAGPVQADDECVVRWSPEAGAGDAREAASKLHAAKKPARVRIPITAFGVMGLAKLRYGEHIEIFLEDDAGAVPEALIVPCIEDGGIREGTCTKEWSSVSEISECSRAP